jgi:hypothetical protein
MHRGVNDANAPSFLNGPVSVCRVLDEIASAGPGVLSVSSGDTLRVTGSPTNAQDGKTACKPERFPDGPDAEDVFSRRAHPGARQAQTRRTRSGMEARDMKRG